MKSRRGFSLIEVLVVIVTSSLMLGLCAGLIHILLRVDRAGRAHLVDQSRLVRLAFLFRSDVRAARTVEVAAGAAAPGQRLVLNRGGDSHVEYRIQAGVLIRTLLESGQVRGQDAFRLPRPCVARLEVQEADHVTVASLVLGDQPDQKHPGPPRELRIESILGRDHRFEKKGM